MTPSKHSLAALIGSRICHDLISPIGAITNGLELMEMGGKIGGEEMTLVSESVGNASARIRFFRISFGLATEGQQVSTKDIISILHDVTDGGRLSIDWQARVNPSRREARAVFLGILCLETALGAGGEMRINQNGDTWSLEARADKIIQHPDLWAHLTDATEISPTPAQVQFALLPESVQEMGRNLDVHVLERGISIRF